MSRMMSSGTSMNANAPRICHFPASGIDSRLQQVRLGSTPYLGNIIGKMALSAIGPATVT